MSKKEIPELSTQIQVFDAHSTGSDDLWHIAVDPTDGYALKVGKGEDPTQNTTFQFPETQGSPNDVLTISDAEGNTAWVAAGAGSDTAAIHDNEAAEITAITAKDTPDADDVLIIEDSAAGDVKKKVLWGNITGSTTVGSHALGGSEHTSDTLANLNSKIIDATLIDTGDSRLSDDRNDADAIHDNVSAEVSALTAKTTLAGSDVFIIEDSAAGNAKKKVFAGDITGSGAGGDVTKVGTPVDNQLAIWTGDGTVEGTGSLTYDGTIFAITGTVELADRIIVPFGSPSAPSIAFDRRDIGAGTDFGFYYDSVNNTIVNVINGVARLSVDASAVFAGNYRIEGGSQASPGYASDGDADTGIHLPQSDDIMFVVGGEQAYYIVSGSTHEHQITGNLNVSNSVLAGTGSAAVPSFAFFGKPDTGLYSDAANTIGIGMAGGVRYTFNTATGFFPNTTYQLGANSKPWGLIYGQKLTNTSGAPVSIPNIDNDGNAVTMSADLTVTGTIFPAAGSAGSPSIAFDSNDGLYNETTGFAATVNGSRKMSFYSSVLFIDVPPVPRSDGSTTLGLNNYRWNRVYANSIRKDDIGSAVEIPNIDNVGNAVKISANLNVTGNIESSGSLLLSESSAPPPSATAGYGTLYVTSSDNHIYFKDSGGNEFDLTATGSGGGGGNVTKVGTPVDNQIGIWTGDGTIEGTGSLTFDGTDFELTGNLNVSANANADTFRSPSNFGSAGTPVYAMGASSNIGMYTDAGGDLSFSRLGSRKLGIFASSVRSYTNFQPGADNSYNLGDATLRWNNIYAHSLLADDAGTPVAIPYIHNNGNPVEVSASLIVTGSLTASVGLTTPLINNTGSAVVFGDIIEPTDGASTTPAISWTSDAAANYGMYFSEASDFLGISAGSVKLAFYNSGAGMRAYTNFSPQSTDVYNLGFSTGRWNRLYAGNVRYDDAGTPVTIPAIDNDGNAVKIFANLNVTGNVESSGSLLLSESSGAPPSATAGYGTLYVTSSDNHIYFKDSGGTEYDLTSTGSGDVTKVGTPVDNQIAIWTGDGTVEGTGSLTYDGTIFAITGNVDVLGDITASSGILANNGQILGFNGGVLAPTIANKDNPTYGINLASPDITVHRGGTTSFTFGSGFNQTHTDLRPSGDFTRNLGLTNRNWAQIYVGKVLNTDDATAVTIPNIDNDGNAVKVSANLNVTGNIESSGSLLLSESNAPPPSATAGYGTLYVTSSDNHLYFKDSGGTEYDLTATGSGGGLDPHGFADVVNHTASTLAEVNTLISDATLIDTGDSRLSDDRDANPHGFADVVRHTASTLAEMNSLVSDATLIDTGDSRLSDDRDPNAHGFADETRHTASTLAQVNALISDATLDDSGDPRTDNDAIHDNVASEISAITQKGTPVASDWLLIEDSADSNNKKRVAVGSLTGSGGTGDVSKTGTPADNQVAIWTADGIIEGTGSLTFDGDEFELTGNLNVDGDILLGNNLTDQFLVNRSFLVTTPHIAAVADPDTGFAFRAVNQWTFIVSGQERFRFRADGLRSETTDGFQLNTAAGVAATPSYTFQSDLDTGMFRDNADELAFSVGGVEALRIVSGSTHQHQMTGTLDIDGVVYADNGAAATPAYTFSDDSDTGMYRSAANRLVLATNGGARLQLGESTHTMWGNLLPGTSTVDLGRSGDEFAELWVNLIQGSAVGTAVTIPVIDNDGSAIVVEDGMNITGSVEITGSFHVPGVGVDSLKIGRDAIAGEGTGATIVGVGASGSHNSTVFGASAAGSNNGASVAIGYNASANGSDSVAIGPYTNTNNTSGIAIGSGVSTANSFEMVFGNANQTGTTATSSVYFGNGQDATFPYEEVAFYATSGNGSNKRGSDYSINGGNSTGTGKSGEIIFRTATPGIASNSLSRIYSERMRITNDSNINFTVDNVNVSGNLNVTGNVMVGELAGGPDTTMHIHKASAGAASSNVDATLTVENSSTNYIQLLSPTNVASGLLMGEPGDSAQGYVIYFGSTDSPKNTMAFGAGSDTRMIIKSNGDVAVGEGVTNSFTPDSDLHVYKGSAGTVVGQVEASLTLENHTTHYLQMLAPNANVQGLLFGCPSSNSHGGVFYYGPSDTPASTMMFRAGTQDVMYLTPGSTAPTALIEDSVAGTAVSNGVLAVNNESITTGKIALQTNFSNDSTLGTTDYSLVFRAANTIVGSVHSEVVHATFTGAHYGNFPENAKHAPIPFGSGSINARTGSAHNSSIPDIEEGIIVNATGDLLFPNPRMPAALPKVEVTTGSLDSRVFGVYAGYATDEYKHAFGQQLHLYQAVGEGMVLVTDQNGDIQAGDLLCSSDRYGHAMKQPDDIVRSYTLGKATQDLSFNSGSFRADYGFISKLIACTYMCG